MGARAFAQARQVPRRNQVVLGESRPAANARILSGSKWEEQMHSVLQDIQEAPRSEGPQDQDEAL